MRHLLFAIVAFYGLTAQAAAPTIESFTLKNGLEVVVIENHRVPAVSHMIWYRIGGADDPLGKSGLAHFHEHVMFKGTKQFPAGEFESIVSRLGGQQNAFTSYDMTAYYINIGKEHLGKAMELEADRMRGLTPIPAEVLKEREVIIEERRLRIDNVPDALLSEQMNAALFVHHPYGTPLIGWKHEMAGLTLADVQAFHTKYYHPNNAVLVLSGDITVAEAKPLVEKYYGGLKRADIPKRTWVEEPKPSSAKRISMTHPLVNAPLWVRDYEAASLLHGDAKQVIPLMLFAEYLGGGETSVFYRELVMKQKLATSIAASYDGFARGPETFSISAIPAEGVAPETLEKAIDATLKTALETVPAPEDFARAKTLFKADSIYAREGLQGMANIVGQLRMLGLPATWFETWDAQVDAATPEQSLAAAKATLIETQSITGLLLPEKKGGE
jgi:zinc protease